MGYCVFMYEAIMGVSGPRQDIKVDKKCGDGDDAPMISLPYKNARIMSTAYVR